VRNCEFRSLRERYATMIHSTKARAGCLSSVHSSCLMPLSLSLFTVQSVLPDRPFSFLLLWCNQRHSEISVSKYRVRCASQSSLSLKWDIKLERESHVLQGPQAVVALCVWGESRFLSHFVPSLLTLLCTLLAFLVKVILSFLMPRLEWPPCTIISQRETWKWY
jgi:hypothetical protein